MNQIKVRVMSKTQVEKGYLFVFAQIIDNQLCLDGKMSAMLSEKNGKALKVGQEFLMGTPEIN